MLLAALALVAADPDQVLQSYRNCVTSQAVRLGGRNTETADTILRAVRSICEPQWRELSASAGGGLGVPAVESALLRWRTEAEDAAVAALLEARAKRP
jgi:hypothetical protein